MKKTEQEIKDLAKSEFFDSDGPYCVGFIAGYTACQATNTGIKLLTNTVENYKKWN